MNDLILSSEFNWLCVKLLPTPLTAILWNLDISEYFLSGNPNSHYRYHLRRIQYDGEYAGIEVGFLDGRGQPIGSHDGDCFYPSGYVFWDEND